MIQKHVIVAEDDPGIQDVIRLLLEMAGYKVTVYDDGQALMSEKIAPADIYLLDRQLSGTDGSEVCRYLKRQSATSGIPVIMMSASKDIIATADRVGADDYLEKPFSILSLREKVERLCPH